MIKEDKTTVWNFPPLHVIASQAPGEAMATRFAAGTCMHGPVGHNLSGGPPGGMLSQRPSGIPWPGYDLRLTTRVGVDRIALGNSRRPAKEKRRIHSIGAARRGGCEHINRGRLSGRAPGHATRPKPAEWSGERQIAPGERPTGTKAVWNDASADRRACYQA